MPSGRVIRVAHADDGVAAQSLRRGVAAVQAELGVTDFASEVLTEAQRAADNVRLPDDDQTGIGFITIDPPGSMDLDQAMHIERHGDGYTIRYAIADLASFVNPGGALDLEVNKRGLTLYGADSSVPLHPEVLSHGAASLLPDQIRPALLWTTELDQRGGIVSTHVARARVKSIARLDYASVQAALDGDTLPESYADTIRLLKEVGELRTQQEIARGGITLNLPDQEIEVVGDHWRLEFRQQLPIEQWNAQISLLTGFGAANLMLGAKIGLLRTLPPPDPRDVDRLRRTAAALGVEWGARSVAEFVRSLDGGDPKQAAVLVASTRLLRGSAYAGFDGEVPALHTQAALAAAYAHVTAPLRRLIDRYAGEICVAICAGQPIPSWVRDALSAVPETMRAADRRSSTYEKAILDLVEAGVLAPQVGQSFDGVIVDVSAKDPARGSVTLRAPAVEAAVTGTAELPLGQAVKVTLTTADVASRKVAFTLS